MEYTIVKESGYTNSNTLKTFLTSTVSIGDLTRTGSNKYLIV